MALRGVALVAAGLLSACSATGSNDTASSETSTQNRVTTSASTTSSMAVADTTSTTAPATTAATLPATTISTMPGTTTPGTTAPSTSTTTAPADVPAASWTVYGHDLANTRLSAEETEIDRDSVARLRPSWSKVGITGVVGTPAVVDGAVYFGDWNGTVWALDVVTGDALWSVALGFGSIVAAPAVDGEALYLGVGRTLTRLDRITGTIDWQVETSDHPQAQISASAVLVDGLVIQGTASFENFLTPETYTFRGAIAAYDAESGDEVWALSTTPNDATAGAGVGVWSTPAVDIERGILYVGTGQTFSEPTAPLGDSIIAIDARTGALVWSTQFTYPDVFSNGFPNGKDADVGASPNLWTAEGRDFVGAGDKGGTFHALDRETGEVVWETELTPGGVLGGQIGSSALVDGRLIATSNVSDPATNFPTDVAKVFALDPSSGDIVWTAADLAGKVFAPVSAVPGVAFVATDRGLMMALDTDDGSVLWEFDAPNQVASGPSIVDGRVIWGYGFVLFGAPGDGGVLTFVLQDDADAPAEPPTTPGVVHSLGCTSALPVETGLTAHTMNSGGTLRRYLLDVPEDYDGAVPLPLVLALHPLNVDHTFIPSMVGFDDMQLQYDFVGVAPSGRLDGPTPFWDASPTDDNADVAFLGELLDELGATLCLDESRIFSTGMSNGAQMSSTLACRLPGRIAVIAPVAGVEFLAPCDGDPVPILAFHGTDDRVLPYTGGGLNATTITDTHLWKGNPPDGLPVPLGIDDSMDRWAEHNGCGAAAIEEQISAEVRRRTWPGCDAETVLYIIDGGGHTWPGKPVPGFEDMLGHTTTDIDATALMFDLFLGPPFGAAN